MSLTTPADVTTNTNTSGNVVNKPAPKVIAPLQLPGVIPRGTNDIPEETTEEHVVDEGNSNENGEERLNEEQEGDGENNPEPKAKIKFFGKEYDTIEQAEADAKRHIIAARGSQSKTAKDLADLRKEINEIRKTNNPANNKPSVIEPDPETKEFWNDVLNGYLGLEAIQDPKERARQNTIITASIVTRAIENARAELLEELSKDLNPIKEERQRTQAEMVALKKAHGVFTAVAKEKDSDDGTVLFPELAQEKDLDEIVNLWEAYRKEGMPEKLLYNKDHIKMIILAYRATITGDPNIPVPDGDKKPANKPGKKLPSLPPNLTKGTGKFPGMRIPGVMARGFD